MAKKIKIGIPLFFNNSTNSGIVNYIFNIISALNTLDNGDKPKIILLSLKGCPVDMIKKISYPFIEYRCLNAPNNLFEKVIIKVFSKLKLNYLKNSYNLKGIDLLYPYIEFNDKILVGLKHKIHWLVDFNNKFFPNHYTDKGKFYNDFQESLTARTDHIALSSYSLFEELKEFYPNYKNEVSILRFACSLPNLANVNFDHLKTKFGLTKGYIMSPNQFWEHKNQLIIIKALHYIKENHRLDFDLVFTGSMDVNRGKGHMLGKLLDLVKEYGLESNIKFLGIIEREEQLVLMKNCISLIQPSLYEGWSTLVEEAKALNQKIILSNLPVHKEQNCLNSVFFDPMDYIDLGNKIINALKDKSEKKIVDYRDNINEYGRNLNSVFKKELAR